MLHQVLAAGRFCGLAWPWVLFSGIFTWTGAGAVTLPSTVSSMSLVDDMANKFDLETFSAATGPHGRLVAGAVIGRSALLF